MEPICRTETPETPSFERFSLLYMVILTTHAAGCNKETKRVTSILIADLNALRYISLRIVLNNLEYE